MRLYNKKSLHFEKEGLAKPLIGYVNPVMQAQSPLRLAYEEEEISI